MSNCVKPVVSLDEGMAEGVYAADHTKEAQTLTITFNQEVTYRSSMEP